MTPGSADLAILLPAFAAGLLVLATHVPLGMQVLSRGIVFIDLALAQVAGLGVVAATYAGFEEHGWEIQAAAVGAALGGALLLIWTEKRWPEVQEALIGALFVLAATGVVLLLAHHPQGGEHLQDLLAGQILWVSPVQLAVMAVLTGALLALWLGLRRRPGRGGFYLVFAVSVTASVQLVGVYLVFASLILPALAVRPLGARGLWLGYGIGAAGYALGLTLSLAVDLPSGPAAVWGLAAAALAGSVLTARFAAAPAPSPEPRR